MHSVTVKQEKPVLRKILLEGDFFLGAAYACTLSKLALRYASLPDESVEAKNKVIMIGDVGADCIR